MPEILSFFTVTFITHLMSNNKFNNKYLLKNCSSHDFTMDSQLHLKIRDGLFITEDKNIAQHDLQLAPVKTTYLNPLGVWFCPDKTSINQLNSTEAFQLTKADGQ